MNTIITGQEGQFFSISTPLGADVLHLRAFAGYEAVSEPFQFSLNMISENAGIDLDSIVGQTVTVTIDLPGQQKRYIHGYVTSFHQLGKDPNQTFYQAEIRPWFWLLTMERNCRIFQNQTVVQIIEGLFGELGFTDFRNALTGTYQQREYCVQYAESVFDFVSRLMEDEGISYFFEHEDGKHNLVMGDSTDAHEPCPGLEVAYFALPSAGDTMYDPEVVTGCSVEQQVVPKKHALEDFNFETPTNDLLVEAEGSGLDHRVYDYPGDFTLVNDGNTRVDLRVEASEATKHRLRGESYCRAFTPGYSFELSRHYRDDFNRSYVLRRVSHQADAESYTNSFEAFRDDVVFRPPRVTPLPRIAGSQTAIVTGKSGEEIWTDSFGRIKVQFHWDQEGQFDENSSCWIRVDQGWAGKQWGGFFLPRIGQEVIVSFLEGDPDRPIVTGSVYNGEQMPPYGLPDEQTKSTLKSLSSKGGSAAENYNEIRYEDKMGEEEFYVQAEKDMNILVKNDRSKEVQNDETNTIKNNRTTTIQEGNETLTVSQGDRTVEVTAGNETYTVGGTREATVTGDETRNSEANLTAEVGGNQDLKITGNDDFEVGGNQTGKVTGNQDITVSGNYTLTVSGNLTINVTGNIMLKGMGITTKSDGAMTVNAGGAYTQSSGAATTIVSGSPINVQAPSQILTGALINLKGALKIG
jgi:type VI secretion system secreted protein VgrG